MPVFHFHIARGDLFIRNHEGFERSDFAAARLEAILSARYLMSSEVRRGELRMDQAIHIHDAQDRHLGTVNFDDALRISQTAP